MSDFERLKKYYENNWATKEQLQKYVLFNKLTSEEYEKITGDAYPAA